jgi:RNA polymerase-binding protein DksA
MPGTAGKKPAARRSATSRTRATQPTRRAGAGGTKRVAAKKAGAGRSAPKKTRAKRPAVKKTARKPSAKSTAKQAASKKTGPKQGRSKRAGSKKAGSKKAGSKKAGSKKAGSKKAGSKKAVSKKTGPKKVAPKKAPPKKPAPTRPTAKKAPPAGATAKRPSATTSVAGKKAAPAKVTAAVTGKAKPTFAPLPPPAGTPTKGRGGKKTVICSLSGFEVTPAPANLSPKTLDRLRQKLLDEKQRLRHQAEELTAEAEQLAREREAGDTQFDEESGEGDTVNIERERDLLLSATARQVVEEIDDAIERIKRGKYGACKPAGRKISLERLEAIPWAQVCVDCKARAERRR